MCVIRIWRRYPSKCLVWGALVVWCRCYEPFHHSISESEAMVLSWKRWIALSGLGKSWCPKWRLTSILGSCSQVSGGNNRDWKTLCILLDADAKPVCFGEELSRNVKLSIYLSIYVPTLTNHRFQVLNDFESLRVRSKNVKCLLDRKKNK